ncbi:ATP-dependent DNA helicase RecG [Klebsiella pneumoniae]|uniref:ATP-dependent DNA helicase RecG n=1 Tax=Klebsiella pneumoniae TaxID=573 RepID=A0A447RV62_KLEPN|nr:ATP-dependent DNA helicase RecG [Klebsiella pneumoniae]
MPFRSVSLTGVGAAQSSKLAKIGLHTVQDLLLHLPLRYEDRTHLYPIAELLPRSLCHRGR